MRLLVDSTFVIDYLKGLPDARRRWETVFAEGDEPFVNEIVVCEVRAGLHPYEESSLRTFLEPVEFVQPGLEAAIAAGRWRTEARTRGRRLSLEDALIAAAADANDAAVLTRNIRDFALTPIRVETY